MKKFLFPILFLFLGFGIANAQSAFSGEEDVKLGIGANIQNNGRGILATLDYGLGESFSVGAQGGYLINVDEITGIKKANFADRIDLKVRLNAHLGPVFNMLDNVDIYPGLDLGFRNFGFNLGGRYFFTNGFGLFAEIQVPIARFKSDVKDYDKLNNQFNLSIGASFDLNP